MITWNFIRPAITQADRRFNTLFAGKEAGWLDRQSGYRLVMIDERSYKAHRLAYFLMTGEDPFDRIDHINMDKSDNKWENLRDATHSQNMANCHRYKNNKSGIKGVYWYPPYQKWNAQIRVHGKLKNLGYFDDIEDAAATIRAAHIKYRGEFARAA
jgi:hypothetical protein